MRYSCTTFLTMSLALWLAFGQARAERCDCDIVPPQIAAYTSVAAAASPVRSFGTPPPSPALDLPAFRLDSGSSNRGGWKYLPLVFSLVIPGTGEIYMGYYVRGTALVAAEAVAWTGYAHYHNKGNDGEDAYRRYADRHWDYDGWIAKHPASAEYNPDDPSSVTFEELDEYGRTVWMGWPGYHVYSDKYEEPINYYENIGKYDWFISGWDDYTAGMRDTANRDTYRAMRKESNDAHDTAQRFIYLSVAARAFSLVETLILINRSDPDQAGVRVGSSNLFLAARSTGMTSGELAFEYRFK